MRAARSGALLDSSCLIEIVGIKALHMIGPRSIHAHIVIDHEFGQPAAVDQNNLRVEVLNVGSGLCREGPGSDGVIGSISWPAGADD